MNLSVIERMARDGDMSIDALRYLLNCNGECEWLDFKREINIGNDKELSDFVRDVIAIKNVGGGYLVIGVEDKTWNILGLKERIPYDTKQIKEKINHVAKNDIEINLVQHTIQIAGVQYLIGLFLIRASKKRKKRRMPSLIQQDFCKGKPYELRRGDIYARKGDSTVKIASQQELEELLDTLEEQVEQDVLEALGNPSNFEIEDGSYKLLEKGFIKFIGRERLKQETIKAVTHDPRIWIINIHGPGGVGKSALVNWVVHEFYKMKKYDAILQLTAKDTKLTEKGIIRNSRSLYSLENLLDHIISLFDEPVPNDLENKKTLATDLLSVFYTLLVLDNMETVNDGRILSYVQNLPIDTRAKVLLTSRQKTGSWELPVPVNELNVEEVKEFVLIRCEEMGIKCDNNDNTFEKVWKASGGLPLAIQWILGRCRVTGSLENAMEEVCRKDSPVLEFSFGNIWKVLNRDAKAILAIMTIFEEPPTIQELMIATEFEPDRIEKALNDLCDVTLATKNTQKSDGRTRYVALPITLDFARHQLKNMGDYEVVCRQRYQKYTDQMKLHEDELQKFINRFERFDLNTDNEKRAAILCSRGESETFLGNYESADSFFKQARELAPQSAYVLAMSANYELSRKRVGESMQYIKEACEITNKKTGSLCYQIKSRIFDVQKDKHGKVTALQKALEYEPTDIVIRHQYGVALSKINMTKEAIEQFDIIIKKEQQRGIPTQALLIAYKTRIINLKRENRFDEGKKDLEHVTKLLVKYPHLAYDAPSFRDI